MEEYLHEFIAPSNMLDIRLEYSHDPGNSLQGKHFHDWIEIIYLIHGDLSIKVNNKEHILKEDDVFIINPMNVHSTRCVHGNEAILVQLPVSVLEKYMPDIRNYQFGIASCGDPAKTAALRKTLNALWQAYRLDAPGSIFLCYSEIFSLAYILVDAFSVEIEHNERKSNERNRERLIRILDYVEHHHAEKITLRQMADEIGLNEIYFARFFKANMGLTFMEYINEYRIEKIHRDIVNTNLSIKDIQERHGFTNDRVFRRMFKDLYGCTPHETRCGK